jgi:predicted ATPase
LWHLGYPDQALQQSTRALTLAQDLSHPFSLAEAQFCAGVVHTLRRQVRPAQACLKAVLALSREQGFPHWVTLGTVLWGWTLVGQGRIAAGITQMRQGLDAWRATSGEAARPWLLSLLAEAHRAAGQSEPGLAVIGEAIALVQARAEHQPEAELYRLQGELHLVRSITLAAEAEACFHQALAIARQQQAKAWELRTAVSLSRLWLRQGKRGPARQLLEGVYGWFTEGFDTPDLHEAETTLAELSASSGVIPSGAD